MCLTGCRMSAVMHATRSVSVIIARRSGGSTRACPAAGGAADRDRDTSSPLISVYQAPGARIRSGEFSSGCPAAPAGSLRNCSNSRTAFDVALVQRPDSRPIPRSPLDCARHLCAPVRPAVVPIRGNWTADLKPRRQSPVMDGPLRLRGMSAVIPLAWQSAFRSGGTICAAYA